jgi:hypothetical protein
LWLLLLLITAQQGAVIHEVGHLAGVHGIDVRADQHGAADSSCALCPVFAQVVTPAFSYEFNVPIVTRAEIERGVELRVDAADYSATIPRSRGPPSTS